MSDDFDDDFADGINKQELQDRKNALYEAILHLDAFGHAMKRAWGGNDADISYSALKVIKMVARTIENAEKLLEGRAQ